MNGIISRPLRSSPVLVAVLSLFLRSTALAAAQSGDTGSASGHASKDALAERVTELQRTVERQAEALNSLRDEIRQLKTAGTTSNPVLPTSGVQNDSSTDRARLVGGLTFGSDAAGGTTADLNRSLHGGESPLLLDESNKPQPVDDRLDQILSWWDKVDIYGHARTRHETDFERIDGPTRNRGRLRARLGFNYDVNPEVTTGLRMTTGDRKIALEPADRKGAPLSYQDTGDVLDKFEFNLDRIFITYKPAHLPGAWVTGGKFGTPIKLNPIFSDPIGDLVWDEAAQPEGIGGGYTWENILGLDKLTYVAAETVVLEKSNNDDASLFMTQLWAEKDLGSCGKLQAGVAYYDYNNLNPDGLTQISFENNFGNEVITVGPDPEDVEFASEFRIINPLFVYTYGKPDVWCSLDQPMQFVYETFYNFGAFDFDRAFGYSIGVAYGPAVSRKDKGDWKVYYSWNEVQQESVFTPFAQDDWLRANNFRGHWIGADIWGWKNVELRLWLLSDEPLIPIQGSDETEWRARADITVYW